LHHIDARHACRRHYPRDNRDRYVDCLPESAGGRAGQALQVLDRFHITTHLNQAVDQVRRGESTSLRRGVNLELQICNLGESIS